MRYGLLLLIIGLGCGESISTETTPRIRLNPGWDTIPTGAQVQTSALFSESNGIHILEGSLDFIATLDGQFGLVLSDQRNDVARITQLYAQNVEDFSGTLVLFTQFRDAASFSSAYFLPIYNPTLGTGMPAYDRRAIFGTEQIEGFVNMQTLRNHTANLMDVLTHEIAHRHAAYLKADVTSSTNPFSLLGREGAHWHAAFNSQGSLLEGYHWRETGSGRFVSIDKQSSLAPIDLYALGLLDPEELSDLFFIRNAKVESGASLPPAADLPIGTVVSGERLDISGEAIVSAMGPRPRQAVAEVRFLYLTRPGESSTSTLTQSDIRDLEQVRVALEAHWQDQTGGRGQLRTTRNISGQADATVQTDLGTSHVTTPSNCQCNAERKRSFPVTPSTIFGLLLVMFYFLGRRNKA